MSTPDHPEHICLNRTVVREDAYSCSRIGELVDPQCCKECYELSIETEEQKLKREIKLNQKIIEYHQSEIGRLRLENMKKSEKLLSITSK